MANTLSREDIVKIFNCYASNPYEDLLDILASFYNRLLLEEEYRKRIKKIELYGFVLFFLYLLKKMYRENRSNTIYATWRRLGTPHLFNIYPRRQLAENGILVTVDGAVQVEDNLMMILSREFITLPEDMYAIFYPSSELLMNGIYIPNIELAPLYYGRIIIPAITVNEVDIQHGEVLGKLILHRLDKSDEPPRELEEIFLKIEPEISNIGIIEDDSWSSTLDKIISMIQSNKNILDHLKSCLYRKLWLFDNIINFRQPLTFINSRNIEKRFHGLRTNELVLKYYHDKCLHQLNKKIRKPFSNIASKVRHRP